VAIFSIVVGDCELLIEYSSLEAARLKFARGEYAEAIALYDAAIGSTNSSGLVNLERGNCYQYLGNYQRALEDYNQAIFIDPTLAKAYYNIGLIHDLVGRQSLALFNYDRAISLNPHYAEALLSRSFARYSLGIGAVIADLGVALNSFIRQGNYSRASDTIDSIELLSSQITEYS
jgi:tetratricopeptide (TPR) repeat protein